MDGVCMKKLRNLPAIDQLMADQRFLNLLKTTLISKRVLTEWLKEQAEFMRQRIINNEFSDRVLDKEQLTDHILDSLNRKINALSQNNLRRVINATGVVLHTNLGRARLSERAIKQIEEVASSYSTLEYSLATGKRGSRHDLVEDYLKEVTDAEAAMVVNNNAAAVYLVLRALAFEKEVIVSRGELIEIGGSFRISEIMKESQAQLIDIGTTNKTHLRDYEKAITEDTALLMKVHKSNFKLIGFTEEVNTEELVDLSRKSNIPIYEDLGSGTLFDFKTKQIGDEPTVQDKVAAGIDIISFSGDKLLGGPQAGIIVGKKKYIEAMKSHQLARVLRVDKFTLAGLEATLKSYASGQEISEVPTVRDIAETKETILKRGQFFVDQMIDQDTGFSFTLSEGKSKVGGGTMPEVEIDTYLVKVSHTRYSSEEIAKLLRKCDVPIIVRVQHDTVTLDFRTIHQKEISELVDAFFKIKG